MKSGTAIRVSFVIVLKILFGKTPRITIGNKPKICPNTANKIAVPAKVSATGKPNNKKEPQTNKK